jgi:hypothetical protein
LSTTDKVYYELGQSLTTKSVNKAVSVLGSDVTSVVAKGHVLVDNLGITGLAKQGIRGSGEVLKDTFIGGDFGLKQWIGTKSTPVVQWLGEKLAPFIPSALGSYLTKTNNSSKR